MSSSPVARTMVIVMAAVLLSSSFPLGPDQYNEGPTPTVLAYHTGGTEEGRSTEGSTTLYSLLSAPEDMHHFGYDLTNLGDTGGDGLDDLVIGYFLGDLMTNGRPGEWGNYILEGRRDHGYSFDQLLEVDAVSTIWDFHANRWLGDVNGDGYDDMVSLLMTQDDEWRDVGITAPPNYIDVRHGGPSGLSMVPNVSIHQPVPVSDRGSWELYRYGGVGDVNGDGYNDLAVMDRLELDLYYGSEDGISKTSSFSTALEKPADAERRWDWYNFPQLEHGDINGDGFSDIVIGNIAGPWITVYNGSAKGISSKPDATDFVRYKSGMSVTSPVNVNGDRYDDIVMVHSTYEGGVSFLAIDAYLGSSQGLPSEPSQTSRVWEGRSLDARDITLFVDIDGNGMDDLLIEHNDPANWTTWYGEMNQYIEYDVFLNEGGVYPPAPHCTFQVPGNYSGYSDSRFGLNAVGDFDGDGYGDVAIGVPDGPAYTWNKDWEWHSRPGYVLLLHGKGIMGRISNLVLDGGPTLYASHSEAAIIANLAPQEGQGAILGATLTLDPGGADVRLGWDPSLSSNPFKELDDPLDCVELLSTPQDVEVNTSTGAFRPVFRFRPNWNWPHEDPVDVELVFRTGSGYVGPLPGPSMFSVVLSLEFKGPPTMWGNGNRPVPVGGWTRAGERVNISAGLELVYHGSGGIGPDLHTGVLMAMDNDGDVQEWPLGRKSQFQLFFVMDNTTDVDEVLIISARDLPGNARLLENLTVPLPVDGDAPEFERAVPDGEDWHSVSRLMVSVTAADRNTSGADPASLQYSWRTGPDDEWSPWTREGLEVTGADGTTEGLVTLQMAEGGGNRVRWRVRDVVGNGPAVLEQDIKVDTQNISFTDPFPDPGDWIRQTTVEAGVTITDLEGSGIDVSTIQYRLSPRNLSQYGDWKDWDETGFVDGEVISAEVLVQLANSGRNYIQWRAFDIAGNGLTTSPHYRIRVDMVAPVFEAFSPGPWEYQGTTEVEVAVTVSDEELGSGVDLRTVEFTHRPVGGDIGDWSAWTGADMTGIKKRTRFSVVLDLTGGPVHEVRFRCLDAAGNGPAVSEDHVVRLDLTPPSIELVSPSTSEKHPDGSVLLELRVLDEHSGVDNTSLGLVYASDGNLAMGTEYPLTELEPREGGVLATIWLEMLPGTENTVRMTARDNLGNEAVSEEYAFWVNRPPVAVISSPVEGSSLVDTEEVHLDGGASSDPDGDGLDCEWLLEGEPLAYGETARHIFDAGTHNITLVVRDDDGAEASSTVSITVEEYVEPQIREEPFDWMLPVIVILVVVLITGAAVIWWSRTRDRSGQP